MSDNLNIQFDKKNIFLDFMSPDNWKTYITFSYKGAANKKDHILQKSLNYAVFLTKDFCILPPSFIMQSTIARKAIEAKALYLEERLIVFPVKEYNLESFFQKKQEEYIPVKDNHLGFYKPESQAFVRKHVNSVIPRKASMGKSIANEWITLKDDSKIWLPIKNSSPLYADKIRTMPELLTERGTSVTLEAIKSLLPNQDVKLDFYINQALQHEYMKTYLCEYDAVIIKNIPPKPFDVNYLIDTNLFFYDYYLINELFAILCIKNFVEDANPEVIIALRRTAQYNEFIKILIEVCIRYKTKEEIIGYFTSLKKSIGEKCPIISPYESNLFFNILQIFEAVIEYYQKEKKKEDVNSYNQYNLEASIEFIIGYVNDRKKSYLKSIDLKLDELNDYIEKIKKSHASKKFISELEKEHAEINLLREKFEKYYSDTFSDIKSARTENDFHGILDNFNISIDLFQKEFNKLILIKGK